MCIRDRLYTVCEFLQSLAVQKSRRSIKGMLEQKPDTVRVQAKDGLTEAEPETVQPGQTIVAVSYTHLDVYKRQVLPSPEGP